MQKHFYKLRFQLDQTAFRARAKRNLAIQLTNLYYPIKQKMKVLDYGCGTGLFQEEFEKRFKDSVAFGIDASSEAIKYCQRRGLIRAKLYNGKKIPFPNDSFDLVYSTDVLEHINDDLSSLNEIKRVLKKKGLAILAVPSHKDLWSTRDIRLQHYRRYGKNELSKKCTNVGLKIISDKNFDFIPYFVLKIMCLKAPQKNGIPDLKRDDEKFIKILDSIFYIYESLENISQRFVTYPTGISQVVVAQK